MISLSSTPLFAVDLSVSPIVLAALYAGMRKDTRGLDTLFASGRPGVEQGWELAGRIVRRPERLY
jgi:hypothetical protein